MTPLFERIAQEQEQAKKDRISFLNSFIGREFTFKGNVYLIEAVSKNLQNFIFCDVLELSTKTVIANVLESLPTEEGFEERNAFLSINY